MAAGDAVRLVLMTVPSAEEAERLVRTLIDEHRIACGNIVPGVTSLFLWKGSVQREAEVVVLAKTTASAVPDLLARAAELHPYEVPELLVLPIEAGDAGYLAWVRECIDSEPKD
ncbi:MAG TPA: divalent-cation tolerance protein CutA [Longimicrobiales bacterium]